MARMFARCIFAALLILSTTLPCSAEQILEEVSIGGFTWNLNELSSPLMQFPDQPGQPRGFQWQTADCRFSRGSRNGQFQGSVANAAGNQSVAEHSNTIFGPFLYSHPEWLFNALRPPQRCYVIPNEKAIAQVASPVRTQGNAESGRGLWNLASVSGIASNIMQVASDKVTPLLTNFAKGIFQTASFTAQHARFPIDSFPIQSVKSVNRRVCSLNVAHRSETNPLRVAERLKPALLPIESAANYDTFANDGRFSNPNTHIGAARKMARHKQPERMDMYWNYYSDCDRWNVVIARGIANPAGTSLATNSSNSLFERFGQLVASAANLDNWLLRAVRQLESQSEMIGRDCQATWKEIEVHLLQASFAKSNGTVQNIHYSTKIRNPD